MYFETDKPSEEWLANVKNSQSNFTADRDLSWTDPEASILRAALFKYGGYILSYWPNIDTPKVAREGVILDGKTFKRIGMEPRNCHGNAARLGSEVDAKVWTGWALSQDGCWRPHSWAEFGGQFIETTEPRVAYFGIRVPRWRYENWR